MNLITKLSSGNEFKSSEVGALLIPVERDDDSLQVSLKFLSEADQRSSIISLRQSEDNQSCDYRIDNGMHLHCI